MYPDDLFTIFGLGFDLFDLCIAVGIICCFLFLWFTFKKIGFNFDAVATILIIGLFAVMFGIFFATLFQSVYDYIADPSKGFRLTGRLTYLGGLLGGAGSYLGIYFLYTRVISPRTKNKILKSTANAGLTEALPLIPVGIAIAHAFGRLGCFFAGCCSGRPTTSWIGIICSQDFPGQKVVPIQLFEFIFMAILAVVMAVLFFKFRFNANFGIYACAYGVWRFIIEFFRGDDRGALFGALTPSQFWSIALFLVGVAYFFAYYFGMKKIIKPLPLPKEEPKKEESKE